MTIGTRIQNCRIAKSITQNRLAQLAGVSRQAVSKWENDQASPDTMHLILLADILETDVEYLATGKTTNTVSNIIETRKGNCADSFEAATTAGQYKSNTASPLLIALVSILSFLLGVIFAFLLVLFSNNCILGKS